MWITRAAVGRQLRSRSATLGLLAVLSAVLVLPSLGIAATPAGAALRVGDAERWSGGPLNGLAAEANTCVRLGSCEDFSLDIETPRSTSTKRVDVTIEITSSEPLTLTLLPPGGGIGAAVPLLEPLTLTTRPYTTQRFEQTHDTGRARLLSPARGVWRVRAACTTPCSSAMYKGVARATWLQTRADGGGGQAVSHYQSGRPAPSSKSLSLQLSRTQQFAGEPTLGVNSRNEVIVQTVPPVRSKDGGRTWEQTGLNAETAAVDPYLYLDRSTGRTFSAINLQGCSQLNISDDLGSTWIPSQAGCGTLTTDHETISAGRPVTSTTVGYPNIVYYCAIGTGTTNDLGTSTICSKSLDGGHAWVVTGTPAYLDGESSETGFYGIPGHCGGASAHLFVGSDGTLYLPRGWCAQPWLAISHDEGLSWTRVQVAKNGMNGDVTSPDHGSGVGVDARGNIYYTWVAHDRLPYLAISRDHGHTFGKPMMMGYPGLREAALPSLAVTPSGNVLIGYMGSLNSPGAPWTGDYSNTTFNGFMSETLNPLSADPIFHTAPVSDLNIPLVRGTCGPVRCQAVYDFITVTFGPDGTGWGAFVDTCPDWCGADIQPQGPDGLVAHLR